MGDSPTSVPLTASQQIRLAGTSDEIRSLVKANLLNTNFQVTEEGKLALNEFLIRKFGKEILKELV